MFGRFTVFVASVMFTAGAFFLPSSAYAAGSAVLTLDMPCVSSDLSADAISSITWTHSDGYAPFVNLSYSIDNGATWNSIVRNTPNDGSYAWTVAHVQSRAVLVKVEETDLAEVFISAVSAPFSIRIYAEDNSAYWESDEVPLPEVLEHVDGIMPGDFVRLEGSQDVSYVDDGMIRRPFADNAAFLTYKNSDTRIFDISQNTYRKMEIGAVMLPQAGTVLIKTPSASQVYVAEIAQDGKAELHRLSSETLAEEIFGASWKEYVLDVDATAFVHYRIGNEITEAYPVDTLLMKRVADLH